MLSILIPTYRFDCSPLVRELSRQAEALRIPYEILVCDDGSPDNEEKEGNRRINDLPHCRFIELPENRGAAHNRNFLAAQAQYDYFLFLDSDLMPCDGCFVKRYVQAAVPDTVIGGTIRFRVPDLSEQAAKANLRYVYALAREERPLSVRNKNPYAHFSAFSCLIPRAIFNRICFCEELTSYGHEDTLYGKELQAAGIAVRYIDNPVFHDIVDSSELFLQKTETSLHNAWCHHSLMGEYVRILNVQQRVKRMGLQGMVRSVFALFEKRLRRHLLGAHPRLWLFDFYKLGYLCRLDHTLSQKSTPK